MAAVVYGDTIAAPYEGFVAVTPENLTNVIVPALEGLVGDRLVTGAGAALDEALVEAAALLGSALAPDQHVLIVGSGAASDPSATVTACTGLMEVGVMTSAVLAGEGSFLTDCVAARGTGTYDTNIRAAKAVLNRDIAAGGISHQPRYTER